MIVATAALLAWLSREYEHAMIARGDFPLGGQCMKVVDPVCKMTIDSEKAVATSEYKGQTIYFCAKGCKIAFDRDPEKYVGK